MNVDQPETPMRGDETCSTVEMPGSSCFTFVLETASISCIGQEVMPPTGHSLGSLGDKWYQRQPIAFALQLLNDKRYFWLVACLLCLGETALSFLIIRKIPCKSRITVVQVSERMQLIVVPGRHKDRLAGVYAASRGVPRWGEGLFEIGGRDGSIGVRLAAVVSDISPYSWHRRDDKADCEILTGTPLCTCTSIPYSTSSSPPTTANHPCNTSSSGSISSLSSS